MRRSPNTAFSEIPCTDRYVEGPRAVGALAGALIARHLASAIPGRCCSPPSPIPCWTTP